ncbi:DUF1501 domain-containing protein [Hydrogenimonas sp.]
MHRRTFIKFGAVTTAALFFSPDLFAFRSYGEEKILILLELKGGNDGLNTLVPLGNRHELYRRLRPHLAISENEVIPLTREWGFHPSLAPLQDLWQEKSLAIVHGVGYPRPNRSHFRSIDIWNTASHNPHISTGWLDALFEKIGHSGQIPAVVMGGGNAGPLLGPHLPTVTMHSPERFIRQAKNIHHIRQKAAFPPTLSYIVSMQNRIVATAEKLEEKLQQNVSLAGHFPKTGLGKGFSHIARLIASGVDTPVYKLTLGGFDTHVMQKEKHALLLKNFAEATAAFAQAMKEVGRWNDIVFMTYSEFGRRASENGSGGTDHGTASVQFLLGGGVKGGFHGDPPSLEKLDTNGDLIYTTDFRSVYHTVARYCFGKSITRMDGYPPLELFG